MTSSEKSNFAFGIFLQSHLKGYGFECHLENYYIFKIFFAGPNVVTAAGPIPSSTVCSGAPPRHPFPNTQYGPPPGTAIIPVGTVTPTPSSHGPSPTPSSGSGGHGGFGNQVPGYPNRSKYNRFRGNARQHLTTPPTSPAKNRGKESMSFRYGFFLNTVPAPLAVALDYRPPP